VIISKASNCGRISKAVVKGFDETIVSLFDKEDLDRGFVEVINRKGIVDRFPLLTITIAVVSGTNGEPDHIARISDVASELKRYGKTLEGSVIVRERRKSGQPVPVERIESH